MKKIGLTSLKAVAFVFVWGGLMSLSVFIKIDNDALQRLWFEILPFAAMVLVTFLFCRVIEKRTIKIPINKHLLKNTLLGFGLGTIWLGVSVLCLTVSGNMEFQGTNKIYLLPVWFIAVLLNAIMQEYLVRGYLYQLIKKNYNTWAAAIITTVLFTALHGGAFEAGIIPVLNVVTMSVFMALLLEYTGTIMAPIIIHFLWNAIGSLVLGAVSLADDYPHIINTLFTGNTIVSGGSYKLEGSIVVLIVNVLLAALIAFLLWKKTQANRNGD
jgi:membrane protease YdiL (CAAX protease family)